MFKNSGSYYLAIISIYFMTLQSTSNVPPNSQFVSNLLKSEGSALTLQIRGLQSSQCGRKTDQLTATVIN